jgi:hypothetical protein
MSDREPSCTGCGAVAVADGRCNYCRERFGVPLAMVRVDASCDPKRAYLLEERSEQVMVVHPSIESEKWPFVFAGLWAVRERFGAAGAASPEATLNRLVLAVAAVAKRLPHVIEGDPAGYHAGLVEAFDGLMLALQGVPEATAAALRPALPPVPPDPCIACGAPAYQQSNGVWTWDHTCEASTQRRSPPTFAAAVEATKFDPLRPPGVNKPRGFA